MSIKAKQRIFTFITLLSLVFALYGIIHLSGQIVEAQTMVRDLQAEESALLAANRKLQTEIDHSEDEDLIRSIARSELGLVDPGEKVFYDTSSQHN